MSPPRRSQSALEYMMTYGWAILVIVIVAGVLYSLGIFSPSSSLSTTITGFSGFVGTQADCTPSGVLVLSLNDALGNPIFIKYANSTYNGKTFSSNVSETILPDSSGKILILNGCVNSSNVHFSSTVTLEYTEPGQPLPGPYISTGYITGTTSSFVQNTVANFTNSSSMYIPNSSSTNSIWASGDHYSLLVWVNLVRAYGGSGYPCADLIETSEGCTEGAMQQPSLNGECSAPVQQGNSFYTYLGELNGSTAYECSKTRQVNTPGVNSPYNKWVFVAQVFSYNPSTQSGWMMACANNICSTNTSWNLLGGPGFYYNPKTDIANGQLNGMMANLQMYNVTLTPSQLTEAYDLGYAGIPVTTKGLVAWLPLDGNTNDYSGNNNNGVATNVNWVSP